MWWWLMAVFMIQLKFMNCAGDASEHIKSTHGYFGDIYYAEYFYESEKSLCPTDKTFETFAANCELDDSRFDCAKKSCCPGYRLIGDKCYPDDVNPCTLSQCDQECNIYLGRVICSCYLGYFLSLNLLDQQQRPFCTDEDECRTDNGNCEQICQNSIGSYLCLCEEGFSLGTDKHNCFKNGEHSASSVDEIMALERLLYIKYDHLPLLQNQIIALRAALEMNSEFSDRTPHYKTGVSEGRVERDIVEDFSYSLLDSFVHVTDETTGEQTYCKCKRGPIGPPGAPGLEGRQGLPGAMGPPGEKGEKGSFDFLLLVLADIRHDIIAIQKKVFDKDRPPNFDIRRALRRQRIKEKQRLLRKNLHKHVSFDTVPLVERQLMDEAHTIETRSSQYKGMDISNEETTLYSIPDANLEQFSKLLDGLEQYGILESYDDYDKTD